MPRLNELPAYRRLPAAALQAEGCELVLESGKRVLDLYGGHCVNTLGAGDRPLLAAIERQWKELSFTTNLLDHPARKRFLSAFGAQLPTGSWSVFLSNSGSEANENALKAALAASNKDVVVCFQGAFHGRTAAAAAVSDTKLAAFPRTPFDVRRIPFADAKAAQAAIDCSVGAVILEPIQSLAGVRAETAAGLAVLRRACDESGAILIFDEVQTGNGRLGSPWAAQHFGVIPDAFTTAKGAAGGLPIGITVLSEALASRLNGTLFGSTFGGGPTVLAAATEVALRIARPGFLEHVRAASAALRGVLCAGPVTQVVGAGLLLGLRIEDGISGVKVRDALLERGILVGTSDDPQVLRLSPPLTLPLSAAKTLAQALVGLQAHA